VICEFCYRPNLQKNDVTETMVSGAFTGRNFTFGLLRTLKPEKTFKT